jgi:hypothetical protein
LYKDIACLTAHCSSRSVSKHIQEIQETSNQFFTMLSKVILLPLLCAFVAAAPSSSFEKRQNATTGGISDPNAVTEPATDASMGIAALQASDVMTIQATDTDVTDLTNDLAFSGGATQNGLKGACAALTVIFARGTTEAGMSLPVSKAYKANVTKEMSAP